MRIEYLQISNILSFKYVSDIDQAEKVVFDDGLNIIIGENGSGKSTALEVINFLFRRVLYRQYSVNRDLFERRHAITADDKKQVLQPTNQRDFGEFRLEPNWDTEGLEQRIRIAVQLDEVDQGNLVNIRTHFAALTRTIATFSDHSVSDDGNNRGRYVIDVILNRSTRAFSVQQQSDGNDFGFIYLTDYNFFKEAILLHNTLNVGSTIPPLFESFTLISSYRNYHAFQPSISLGSASASQQIQQIRSQDYNRSLNTSDTSEPPIFALVKLQVAERHFGLMPEAKTLDEREQEANDLPFIRSINERLRVVNLRCRIRLLNLQTWQYSFQFYDTRRNRAVDDINCLSAGQKAIIHLVLEAYGRGELKGGVVIIDEPEIHLHYQFQHEYLQVLRELNKTQNCQYILVTHSESLIDSSTINSVRRFALDTSGHTAIFSPTLSADEKSLIKILDNSRSTYAFFAKKVVLVEGDTDRYFIRAIIQDRHRSLDQEIAVLHIGGKGEYAKWRSLFTNFGLRVFAIADFDYLINLHYPTEKGVALKTAHAVADFKKRNPDWDKHINAEAARDIFILREGDLEAYLGIGKDLRQVIAFCRSDLSTFLADDRSSKSLEIRSILECITQLKRTDKCRS
ncbi:MAG TPA: AAA family ATPase [Bellilinea sp.]|nr:AAA family ATPase [Bellilinea sp.]